MVGVSRGIVPTQSNRDAMCASVWLSASGRGAEERSVAESQTEVDDECRFPGPSGTSSGRGVQRIGHGRMGDRAGRWTSSGTERPLVPAGRLDRNGVPLACGLRSRPWCVCCVSQTSPRICLCVGGGFSPYCRFGVPKSSARRGQFLRVQLLARESNRQTQDSVASATGRWTWHLPCRTAHQIGALIQ